MSQQMGTVSDGVDYLKAHSAATSSSLQDIQTSLDQASGGVETILMARNGNRNLYTQLSHVSMSCRTAMLTQ